MVIGEGGKRHSEEQSDEESPSASVSETGFLVADSSE